MTKLNLSQAAKATGKNRTTIWRHIKSGKLSAGRGMDDQPFVDTSELIRVYGEIKQPATPVITKKHHQATLSYSELIEVIDQLRKEQREIKIALDNFTHRLEHSSNNQENTPENDPAWPKQINTMSDVAKRSELKKKYRL